MRTRVGYTGGRQANPTYYDLGDHTETLQIDYDPAVLSYEALLAVFWQSHSPTRPPGYRQYMSAIFYHDTRQKRLAQDGLAAHSAQAGARLYTEILPAETFYLAEDYHQKYRLRSQTALMTELTVYYPDFWDLVHSTAAARLNGFVSGYGSAGLLEREIAQYGLSGNGRRLLQEQFRRYGSYR